MSLSVAVFWGALAFVAYAYAGYPLLLWLRAHWRPRPLCRQGATPEPVVSFIVCAHDEGAVIAEKLANLLALSHPPDRIEIVLASDGSSDDTVARARAFAQQGVRVLDLPRRGKIQTLNAAVAHASGEILVFTDANSMLEPTALRELLAPFADPTVGGVAGDQRYWARGSRKADGSEGERAYWSLDRRCKQWQSAAGSVTSATGALHAIRRALFRPVPPGVTDDFWISTQVVAQGRRLVFAPDAVAREAVAASTDAEFRRKVRVVSRGLRGVWLMRSLLDPRRYGFYSLQLLSHKVLRRLVGLPVLALAAASPWLWSEGSGYRLFVAGEVLFAGLAVVGAGARRQGARWGRWPVLALPHYLVLVNVAALRALWNLLRGHRIDVWAPERGGEAVRGVQEGARPLVSVGERG